MKRYNAKLDRKIWLHFTARHTAIWRPSLKLSLLLIRAAKERLFKWKLVPVIAPPFPLLLEVKSVSRGHTALKIGSINDIILLQMTTNTASFLKASILFACIPSPTWRACAVQVQCRHKEWRAIGSHCLHQECCWRPLLHCYFSLTKARSSLSLRAIAQLSSVVRCSQTCM